MMPNGNGAIPFSALRDSQNPSRVLTTKPAELQLRNCLPCGVTPRGRRSGGTQGRRRKARTCVTSIVCFVDEFRHGPSGRLRIGVHCQVSPSRDQIVPRRNVDEIVGRCRFHPRTRQEKAQLESDDHPGRRRPGVGLRVDGSRSRPHEISHRRRAGRSCLDNFCFRTMGGRTSRPLNW